MRAGPVRRARDDFHDRLIAALPGLRLQALALTRQRAAAEDLVQEATALALSNREGFVPGTNFAAWMRRILHNHFINTIRRRRGAEGLDEVPEAVLAVDAAAHEDRLVLRELVRALGRLPADHREALFMVALRGMSYEAVAAESGWAVGTLKSRIGRARAQLRASLLGEGQEGSLPAGGLSAGASAPVAPGSRGRRAAHPAVRPACAGTSPSATGQAEAPPRHVIR